jgi:protein-tyrosine phosphatase
MSLLKKLFGKTVPPFDFSSLGVDVHNHFLPGIDDGAKTLGKSIEMLQKMENMGYRKIVMTPHIYPGLYENDKDSISTAFKSVINEQHQFPLLELSYAAEYFFEESLFEKIAKKELLTFYGNHVLFEFSFQNKPNRIDDLIFELNANGYTGVLAHVERYPYLFGNLAEVNTYRERGILIQLNLSSLSGRYGPGVKKQAEQLIEHKLIDVVSTDAHRIDHVELLESIQHSSYLNKLMNLPLKNFDWKSK